MKKLLSDLGAFSGKFGIDSIEPPQPQLMNDELLAFRLNFILEELNETAEANGFAMSVADDGEVTFVKQNEAFINDRPAREVLIDTLDGIVDMMYVIVGMARQFGFHSNTIYGGTILEEAWNRIHMTNMRKIRANSSEDSKRGNSIDIVKPEGWVKPNLGELI
jgi:predicted HAD superfamily Cof-like phosphohydrolase